jgi:hypothetical protein
MRAGRKRKAGERHPSGKLVQRREAAMEPRVIEATPEIQAMRKAVFGSPKADGELCCPIDRLRSRLSTNQYHAGRVARSAYARYCAAIHAPRVVAGQLRDFIQGGGGEPMSFEQAQQAVDDYKDIITAIRRYSFRSLKEVERIMHGAMPRNLDALTVGLTALADHLGFEEREAA